VGENSEQQQDPRTVYHFLFKRPTQTAHPQSLQRPRHDQGPTPGLKYLMFFIRHPDAHTKTPLDQHFSMCVRAQTDPSHLWGDAFVAKLTLVGEIKHP